MGEDSKIEWTHHTFNPWWGCAKVSPGCEHCYAEAWAKRLPDWLIVGGESGGKARPMERAWVESLRSQCDGRTAFFFKQWGGRDKKATGRELDGRTWDALPRIGGAAIRDVR